MDAIRIENLRCLADTDFVELKPITVLLGENSSGKSTFLRTFPLLRQSVESQTQGPLLWYGRFVDFGSFDDALNKAAEKREMSFHFKFRLLKNPANLSTPISPMIYRGLRIYLENLEIAITLKIAENSKQAVPHTEECSLAFAENRIKIKFDSEQKVTGLFVNSNDFSEFTDIFYCSPSAGLIPYLREIPVKLRDDNNSFRELLFAEVEKQVPRNISKDKIRKMAYSFGIGTSKSMLQDMQENLDTTDIWKKCALKWTVDSKDFKTIRDLIIGSKMVELLLFSDAYMRDFVINSHYIAPLRATAERYYRLQNLAVNEVDFQGQNLAMFLRNLTDTERKRFSEWTEKYFGFAVQTQLDGGHISIELKEVGSDEAFNLADIGFGFSQILPILTQLWLLSNTRPQIDILWRQPVPPIFAIEQPELHLHPRLQARLADAFLGAIKAAKDAGIELKLIIETHSETMINRFGHRVANGDIDPQDINVVLFEKKRANAPAQVRFGEYDSDGFLTNWPFGFFEPDEVK
jgi:predicted ATPase